MLPSRVLSSCSSACSTSGRHLLIPLPPRRYLVRTRARKQKDGSKPPVVKTALETIVTDYPHQLEEIGVGYATLASTDPEQDVELLSVEESETDDTASTADVVEGVDEVNPYTSQDALSAAPEGLAGGEPALEALLSERGADLSPERITAIFPFPLDAFQRRALELFLEGRSVVVCAPTGAGKTAIAEAAAAAALARGQRVIYTTPLKALSNQKLFETRRRFGTARCGLQTGDASLNPDADIVVMTTEILRNIMYRTAELAEENNTGSGSTREARLGDVGLIVLDEVHYLGDPHRGSVWEEVIINCPRHIQLLCMSATVKNPKDLGDWIGKEHMPCETIQTRFRPVPLHWHFVYHRRGKVFKEDLMKTSPGGKQSLNPSLSNRKVLLEEARLMLQSEGSPFEPRFGGGKGKDRGRAGRGGSSGAGNGKGKGKGQSSDDDWDLERERELEELLERDPQALQRRINARRVPDMPKAIRLLEREGMLPAIWFILSRRDCDTSAARAASTPLTTPAEQSAIAAEVAALRADQPETVREELVPALLAGVASHHAGQLPGWKALVERLFQRGLLRIVFATGTLAAGINMPARTTVISSLSRMTDEGPRLLPHNELLQMAGRAGRRGFDTEGNCVVLQNRWEGAEEAWKIIRAGPEPLTSQFAVSYGLVLNLLSVNSLEQARQFVSRSFGNYLATEGNARRLAEAESLEKQAKRLVEAFKASATARAKEVNARVKAAKEELRRLKAAALVAQCDAARAALAAHPAPRIVVLNLAAGGGGGGSAAAGSKSGGGGRPLLMPALLIGEMPPPRQVAAAAAADAAEAVLAGKEAPPGPFYGCLTADNRLMRASVVCLAGVLEGPAGAGSEADAERVRTALEAVRDNTWQNVEAGSFALQSALGTPATIAATRPLQARLPWSFVEVDPALAEAVAAARRAVKEAVAALEEQRRQAAAGLGASAAAAGDHGSLEKMAKAQQLLRQAEQLRADSLESGQLESTWRAFQSTMEILICVDALESGSLRVLPLGLLARNIQGGNELWLAMALSHPALQRLSGPALAALLGALLSPEVLSKPVAMWAAYPVSPEVEEAVEALEPRRQLLQELQADAGLSRWNDALLLDLRFAGIVEAWASGASWSQIMADSNLDDGDVARLLIRTIDLLKQLQHNAHLLPQLREAAAEALRGMDRKPVAELTF